MVRFPAAALTALLALLAIAALPSSRAIPNYRPPDDVLATLPLEWYRGLPSPDELARGTLRRRASSTHSSPSSSLLLQSCLLSSDLEIVTPQLNTTEAFWDAAQSDNLHFHWHPSAIVYPRTTQQVSAAVQCAAQHGNTAVSPRSGGHSFAGSGSGGQDGSLIVDMKYIDHVTPRSDGESADVGPGARLGDVVKGLWKAGQRGMPHGTCPPVGVGGHALCGGFGPTSRQWGMTTDVITEAEVVLANGSIVTARDNDPHSRDLFWGLKGAGHNFGIVTNFRFQTFPAAGEHVFFEYRWSAGVRSGEDMARIATAAQNFASDNLPAGVGFHLQVQPRAKGDPEGGPLSLHIRGMAVGLPGGLATFQRDVIPRLWFHGAPRPERTRERAMSYLEIMEEWDDFGRPGDKLDTIAERIHRNNFIARTAIAMSQKGLQSETLSAAFQSLIDAHADATRRSPTRAWSWNTYLEMYGGANARHRAPDVLQRTSFPHRDGMWLIQSSIGTWGKHSFGADALAFIDHLDATWVGAIKHDGLERRAFTCYADAHLRKDQWKELYFGGETLERLMKLKRDVDPGNLFRNGQSLGGPNAVVAAAAADNISLAAVYPHNVHPLP